MSKNDVNAAVYRDFIGGLNFGYLGSKNKGSDNSANWWGNISYVPKETTYFNKYAAQIYQNSQACGFPFSDLQQKVQAQLDDVDTLEITLLPDDILSAPEIISTTTTKDSLTVNWESVSGATGYKVRLLGLNEVDINNATSHTFTELQFGTRYQCYVSAYTATEQSPERQISELTEGKAPTISGTISFTGNFYFVPGESQQKFNENGTSYTVPENASQGFPISLTAPPNKTSYMRFDLNNVPPFKSSLKIITNGTGLVSLELLNNAKPANSVSSTGFFLSVQPKNAG